MWSVMSMLLVFAFGCNLRAIFMKPNYKPPLETSEQVVKSKKVNSINGAECTTMHYFGLPELNLITSFYKLLRKVQFY